MTRSRGYAAAACDWGERIGDIVDGWLFPPEGHLPETLIVPLENPHLHHQQRWVDVFGTAVADFGVVARHRTPAGTRFGVAKPVFGAAATAMLADAAIRRGARRLVGVGFCGGTQPGLRCGDVVAASAARADDGVAHRYLLSPQRSTAPVVRSPGRLIDAVGAAVGRGTVHSVAAVHLEDQSLVDECRNDGVLGIDMETAALYAVAATRSAEALAILTVSDVPVAGTAAEANALDAGARVALHQALQLAGGDRSAAS